MPECQVICQQYLKKKITKIPELILIQIRRPFGKGVPALLACTRTYLRFAFQPTWPQATSPVLLRHQV